ncbi:PH domain-like protein [Tilletiaria anomala UBC 951]|uniref:PH domain-like protein n=1 Tax=Tilletiaria anomala (strain ATCC 24038 / CBS 436.72 / UBC 951) TaxID=1037660 RepID=A0A066W5F5_TILAU|nr:PH domain-like protein [Tilletiaria anomala UBC 951]KDN46299.1 PH domain-like protein [Tilletiaria anomala UBC 951]
MDGSQDAARRDFNMRVLKRHDSSIEKIICSASFVVLYSHQEQWTKTGIEGPMFIYQRVQSPHYGFFIMNRNGVENFSASITPQDDLELTPEFIIYHPGSPQKQSSDDDSEEGDDTYGIWIFEAAQRELIGKELIRLHAAPNSAVPASKPNEAKSVGQNITLDALFGSAAQPPNDTPGATSSPPATKQGEPPSQATGLSLMDQIFQGANALTLPALPASHALRNGGVATIRTPMMAHASAGPPSAAPAGQLPSAPNGGTAPPNGLSPEQQNGTSVGVTNLQDSGANQGIGIAADLMAMLGIKTSSAHMSSSSPSTPSGGTAPVVTNGQHQKPSSRLTAAAEPLDNESTRLSPGQTTSVPQKAGPVAAASSAASRDAVAPLSSRTAGGIIGMALRDPVLAINGPGAEPLSKRDFVRELLSLIHTDRSFVDTLYADYIARC